MAFPSAINRKPDFLIIGVQKSATTWLQERLRQHPDVFMPRDELHYFDRDKNFAKGESWYLAHFENATSNQIIGEKTPDYIWTNCHWMPGVNERKHKRIREFRSDIKLIVILRDPVSRFVSALHHNRRRGRLPAQMGPAELLKSTQHADIVNRMLERGLYATQLKDYYKLFCREQFKILFHDDIRANPDGVLAEVQSFLGVTALGCHNGNSKRYNDYKATEFGARLLGAADGWSKNIVIRLDRYLLSHLPISKVGYPELDETERAFLVEYYKDEVRELPGLVGRILPSGWEI